VFSPSERRKKRPDPTFFVNRSLGSVDVPFGLRADGWVLEAMFEVYGHQMAQRLDDPPWIEDATKKDQAILSKDQQLRYQPEPRDAILNARARVFILAKAELKGEDQVAWFLNNKTRIFRACRKPGPYIYRVYEKRIEHWWPRSSSVGGAPLPASGNLTRLSPP
jgi:hypothetical protein